MRSHANEDAPIPVSLRQHQCATHLLNPPRDVLVKLDEPLNIHDARVWTHAVVKYINRAHMLGIRVGVLEPHRWRQLRPSLHTYLVRSAQTCTATPSRQ